LPDPILFVVDRDPEILIRSVREYLGGE